jgi:hypothetical protein
LGAVSEATPTAGTVPAAEVMGMAWGHAGGAQPSQGGVGGRSLGRKHASDSPFQWWRSQTLKGQGPEHVVPHHLTFVPR